jgi:hypothetical protein
VVTSPGNTGACGLLSIRNTDDAAMTGSQNCLDCENGFRVESTAFRCSIAPGRVSALRFRVNVLP